MVSKMIDAIFTVGGIIFAVGLLPACLNQETRMPLRTSLPTAVVLFIYGLTFAYMGLAWSALSSGVTSNMWFFLAARRRAPR